MNKKRKGSMLLEATMSVVVLSVVLIAVAQLLGISAKQQRDTEARGLAAQELANLMERAMSREWDSLTPAFASSLSVSDRVAARLSEARVRIEVTEETEEPSAKLVVIKIDWLDSSRGRVDPIQLSAWKYRQEEASE